MIVKDRGPKVPKSDRKGRNQRAGQARVWNEDFFHGLGLHRLRGTNRYREAA